MLGQFEASISFKGKTDVIAIIVIPGGTSLPGVGVVQALALHIVGAQLDCLCLTAAASETISQKTATSAHTGGTNLVSPLKFKRPPLLWAKFSHWLSLGFGLAKASCENEVAGLSSGAKAEMLPTFLVQAIESPFSVADLR